MRPVGLGQNGRPSSDQLARGPAAGGLGQFRGGRADGSQLVVSGEKDPTSWSRSRRSVDSTRGFQVGRWRRPVGRSGTGGRWRTARPNPSPDF